MNSILCPACASAASVALESIVLDEQHSWYTPRDTALQQRLTEQAKKSTQGYAMRGCSRCSLQWAEPMIAPNAAWYELAYQALELYPGTRWEFDRVLAACQKSSSVFDIGCGDGAFLLQCVGAGIACRGVDFSDEPVSSCRQRGLDVRRVDLDSAPLERPAGELATVVTAFHVLEHLSRPERLLRYAHAVSADDAVLWIAVPGERRASRSLGERDFLDQPPHHLTRWSHDSLAAIAAATGWSLEVLEHEPLPLGVALWWVATRSRPYRALTRSALGRSSTIERLVRFSLYPAAALRLLFGRRSMTGFSMLGRLRKGAPRPA